jgi:hypothetical protein
VQGILYFPLIRPPVSEWLIRALLYWDEVGTIVPESYVYEPELLGPYTQDLVLRELIYQVRPSLASHTHTAAFSSWLTSLGADALEGRRKRFAAGHRTSIHWDKWLAGGSALEHAQSLGLASDRGRFGMGEWIEVEVETGNEFMASLALALCHPSSGLSTRISAAATTRLPAATTWLPASDSVAAFTALTGGLERSTFPDSGQRLLRLRIEGEARICDLRALLLERALPVPDVPPSSAEIELFRVHHGDLLPALRRRIESELDRAAAGGDDVTQLRAVDRLSEEIEDLVGQAEAYLREAGFRRISRSPLLRLMKFIPGASGPVDAATSSAEALEAARKFESEPLAYFAFAREELKLDGPLRAARLDWPSLVELFDAGH